MTQPFCCDITSGTKEEQNEFKRLFDLATNSSWFYKIGYFGYDIDDKPSFRLTSEFAIKKCNRILPLSEGISILKKMVGEEEKPELNEHGLLPCPFCGGDECEVSSNGASQYLVRCYPCSVFMLDDRKDKVVTNWNNRQPNRITKN